MNKNNGNLSNVYKNLQLGNPVEKPQFEKDFSILFSKLKGFLIIPLTALYHEYIGWPKVTEQKNG